MIPSNSLILPFYPFPCPKRKKYPFVNPSLLRFPPSESFEDWVYSSEGEKYVKTK
jgi:hypothetical protein